MITGLHGIDVLVGTVVVIVFAAVVSAASQLLSDEVLGWLALAPQGALRLVAMRLPADQRQTVYETEWLPELLTILKEADGRPITRLARGLWFAIDMARAVGEVARELDGVRQGEPDVVGYVEDSDSVQAVGELAGIYQETYSPGFSGAGVLSADGQVIEGVLTFERLVEARGLAPPPAQSLRERRGASLPPGRPGMTGPDPG